MMMPPPPRFVAISLFLLSLDGGDLAGGAIVVDNARAFTSKFGERPIFCKISRALYVMWGCTRGAYSYYCYCRVVHLTILKFHSPAAIVSLHYYGLLTRLLVSSTCPTRNLCLEFNSSPSVSAKVPVRCCPP